jgi:hypothetical protein
MDAVCYCLLDSSGFKNGPLSFETGGFYLLHVGIGWAVYMYLLSSWSKAPVKTCDVYFVSSHCCCVNNYKYCLV